MGIRNRRAGSDIRLVKKNILNHNSKIIPILIIGMIAVVGVYLLTISKAASPYIANEAESGTIGGLATKQSSTSANGGEYVQFGSGGGTAPTIAVAKPAENAVLSGTTSWEVTANDPSNVTKVEFYINKQLQWTDTTAPFTFQRNPGGWDTRLESNNLHYLSVKAYDTQNKSSSVSLRVNIRNSVSGGLGPNRSILSVDPYNTGNVWYSSLPATTPLDSNSTNLVNDFIRQYKKYYGTVSVNTGAYSPAFYIATASTPRYEVAHWNCFNHDNNYAPLNEQLLSVPIPSNAMPAPGTDREMIVYDPDTKTMWEMWKMGRVNGKWSACWGGRMTAMDKNLGIFTRPFGTTATGLPFLGSTITIEELKKGEIPHALAFAMPEIRPGGQSWPANRNDGWVPAGVDPENVLWEGQRLRLDPRVNVDALTMHPVGKMIAKAVQKYGMVLRDKSGAVNFYAESSQPYTDAGQPNPYSDIFKGTPSYDLLKGFPWDKLQALPKDYGKP